MQSNQISLNLNLSRLVTCCFKNTHTKPNIQHIHKRFLIKSNKRQKTNKNKKIHRDLRFKRRFVSQLMLVLRVTTYNRNCRHHHCCLSMPKIDQWNVCHLSKKPAEREEKQKWKVIKLDRYGNTFRIEVVRMQFSKRIKFNNLACPSTVIYACVCVYLYDFIFGIVVSKFTHYWIHINLNISDPLSIYLFI